MRGSRDVLAIRVRGAGAIPACAGEPEVNVDAVARAGVHPRVCGGARLEHRRELRLPGPSPRVRGSLEPAEPVGLLLRSIPACAGEPRAWVSASKRGWVHPRVCGGASYCLMKH